MSKRKTHFILALLLFGVSVVASFAQQTGGERRDPEWIKQIAPPRIVYQVPEMKSVRVQKNVIYKRAGGSELKMDVYRPAKSGKNEKLPVIIYIHGGALPSNLVTTAKEWGVFVSHGQLAAASGFVGVTFNHRFYGWDKFGDSRSDINDLIAHLRENADAFGIDKDRISLWAFSAGALFLSDAIRKPEPFIRSLVAYYGIMDLQPMRSRIPANLTDEMLKEFSPLAQIKQAGKTTPPIFLARAGLEEPAVGVAVDRFIQEALAKNLPLDVSNHPNGRHGFDVEDDNDRTREIIRRTIEFIKTHSQ